MTIEDIDRIVSEARSIFPEVRVTGGVSPKEVGQLENLVGEIQGSYRYFLENYGTFGFYGLESYGLIAGNIEGEGPPNAYFMTKADLDDGTIPQNQIVINSTGYGPVYLLSCTTGAVVGWNYTGDFDDDLPKFASFEDFLEDSTAQTLEDYKEENIT